MRVNFHSLLRTKRFLQNSVRPYSDFEHPLKRTLRILGNDVKRVFDMFDPNYTLPSDIVLHKQADVIIIGGGAIGSSVAYWLKEKTNKHSLKVVVVEKDLTYSKCSTTLSVGGLRQQFSLPENIEMSLYGAEFLRTIKKRFGPDAEVNFNPCGYLTLASEAGASQLIENAKLQQELGAINTLLTKGQIKDRFPWMDVTDVELGCLGLEKEGWFDPWSLLHILKKGAIENNVQYVNGEVVDFVFEDQCHYIVEGKEEGTFKKMNALVVKAPDGTTRTIEFAMCVLAAGAESGEIAKKAHIGTGPGILALPLPIEKRKRYVYSFECQQNPPGINTPMTIDHSGVYFRREGLGGAFISGLSPAPEEEPDTKDLEVDHTFFDRRIWPLLANRVPAFNAIKVKGAWSGFYEYNTYDENGILGHHPYYYNFFIASGFSGHGIQHAPAIGRGIAELILDGSFQTIDLTRLNFERLMSNTPLLEENII